MKADSFQNFLLKSAIAVMACDGSIDESEISEIKKMANGEIYFMGFDIDEPFKINLDYVKQNGKKAINEYLNELEHLNLNEIQELQLIEVLVRTIESDKKIDDNEVKFLQMVKSKLTVPEEIIIAKFPKQMNYLIDFHNYGLDREFTDEIKF